MRIEIHGLCKNLLSLGAFVVVAASPSVLANSRSASADPRAGSGSSQAGAAELLEAERALLESLTSRRQASTTASPQTDKAIAKASAALAAAATSAPVQPTPAKVASKAVTSFERTIDSVGQKRTIVTSVLNEGANAGSEARAMLKPDVKVETKVETVAVSPPKPSADAGLISSLKAQNAKLKADNHQQQARIEQLSNELDTARSQLSTAEIEVSRLSGLIDAKNRSSLSKYSISIPNPPKQAEPKEPVARVNREAEARESVPADVGMPATGKSLPVATVVVEKADLRLGPGKNNSALMAVSQGSRLLVEARQGEWYRVFAPSGERAWVHSSAVIFGDIPGPTNGTASRVKGYDNDLESEAFKRFNVTSGE